MSDEESTLDTPAVDTDAVLETVEDWYHVPAVAALAAFMLWLRVRTAGNFIRSDGVLFSGNDAWYHYRQIVYTVQEFPKTMPFDPWTFFPFGTSVGQFGTLFDQLIATGALVVGLGDPSTRTIAEVVVYAPAIIGTLTIVPTYYIGKRLGGRSAGVFAAGVLAFIPGLFLQRSLAGVADHNMAEPLFQATAVLGTIVALEVASREKPVWEQVRDRDWDGLRAPLGWSVLAGVSLALYLWLWPPGVLLVGILGVFYLLQLTADHLRGESPEHVALVGVTSMTVATALLLAPLSSIDFSVTKFTILQPGATASIALFAAVVAGAARRWDESDLPQVGFAAAVFGVVGVSLLGIYLLLPDLFTMIRTNLVRFVGFDVGAGQRTIGEAQPMLSQYATIEQAVGVQYGLAFFTAIFGAACMVLRAARNDGKSASRLLVLVWFAFITAAAFTQVRFNYYLAVPVAVLNGYALYFALDVFGGVPQRFEGVNVGHVTVIAVAVLLVFTPVAVGINADGSASGQEMIVPTPMQISENNGPSAPLQGWSESLGWMADNTPAEGNYGGADNAGALDYYGTFDRTSDFDYPAGYYGVMSWWDYGHWITVQGERIPNANPFQEGATTAANYLLAGSEADANEVLAKLDEDDAKTRYVVADWQMAVPSSRFNPLSGKFDAPTVFYDAGNESVSDFRTPLFVSQNGSQGYQVGFPQYPEYVKHQRYYESQVVRLYRYHGSAVEPQPVVLDWEGQSVTNQGTPALLADGSDSVVRNFDNMSAARAFVANDSTSQIGGYSGVPSETVSALEHYRLVHASGQTSSRYATLLQQLGFQGFQHVASTTPATSKVFERVPGATLQGEAPANTRVTASVQMSIPTRNSTFRYTQFAETDEDGQFTMTLPYSTSGYDEFGLDAGYTNVSVRANSSYTLSAMVPDGSGNETLYMANATVTEGQVLGENDTATQVTLEVQNESANGTSGSTASLSDPDVQPASAGSDGTVQSRAPTGVPQPLAARVA